MEIRLVSCSRGSVLPLSSDPATFINLQQIKINKTRSVQSTSMPVFSSLVFSPPVESSQAIIQSNSWNENPGRKSISPLKTVDVSKLFQLSQQIEKRFPLPPRRIRKHNNFDLWLQILHSSVHSNGLHGVLFLQMYYLKLLWIPARLIKGLIMFYCLTINIQYIWNT